jgi:hypothetical protein
MHDRMVVRLPLAGAADTMIIALKHVIFSAGRYNYFTCLPDHEIKQVLYGVYFAPDPPIPE